MTQNTVAHNTKIVTQAEFLATLYPQPPDGLYFETRCVHPETGEVHALWAQIRNVKQRNSALKQAEKLNHKGYGVYYAPCLRQTKQGRAESAAQVPALWVDIDCDDDHARREAGLAALREFVSPPSAIVDSGGGWHAYWLLDTPFTLQNDDDRQRIARVLHGLFAALDGDPGYVKSVASVMRLPGSTNTKPGRNNALVEIVEWQPDRRYPLRDFDWLDVTPPKPERIGKLEIVTLNGNGHHSLPPRTEAYLTSGALREQRNTELFAAACQLRDAGYSQRDAEGELVARYVSDGNGSENPAGREKEAHATISSAFSRPPREPIPAPKEHARHVVGQLVGRFEAEPKPKHPTTQQIVEAVEACVHLNPVEWAEERQRLKTVCGEGLKISDIDRLYKEKKRALDQQQQAEYVDTEGYLLLDGKIIYRKESYRGTFEKTVTDWAATALYQTCQVDDDGKEFHMTTIQLQRGSSTKKLEVPGEVFVDDVALRRFIGANAGVQYVVRAGMNKHLVPAIVQLSGEFPTHRHYNFMGWMERDGRWVYVSPQDCITATGKLAEPPSVELDQRLRDYGLQTADWPESLAAFDAVTKVLPTNLAPALLAFALLPVIQRFFPDTATKPAVHLVGTSGSGKSEIASLLSSFYGHFSRDTPPAQWGDTINMVEMLGYPLADALYWVDDYKDIYADTRTFTRFMQSYSRNLGRGRLTREAKLQTSRPCRGLILSTGETSLEREMSVSSRMMALEIPPWKQRDPGGQALREAEALRDRLPGFTAHFASWVARQLDSGDFKAEIASRFSQNLKGYTDKVTREMGKSNAHDRAVKNWAVLVTVYQLLSNFIDEIDGNYLLPAWQDCIVETVRSLREQRASEVFLDILGQLIGSGQCLIEPSLRIQGEAAPGHTVVGYRDESFLYLLPDVALREVNKVQPLSFSAHAIGSQLREDGLLLPGKTNLTVQKSVRGSVIRLWRLKSEVLGCEGCEPCEDGC